MIPVDEWFPTHRDTDVPDRRFWTRLQMDFYSAYIERHFSYFQHSWLDFSTFLVYKRLSCNRLGHVSRSRPGHLQCNPAPRIYKGSRGTLQHIREDPIP